MSLEQKIQMYIRHAEERMHHFNMRGDETEFFRWSRTRTNLLNRLKEVERGEWNG